MRRLRGEVRSLDARLKSAARQAGPSDSVAQVRSRFSLGSDLKPSKDREIKKSSHYRPLTHRSLKQTLFSLEMATSLNSDMRHWCDRVVNNPAGI